MDILKKTVVKLLNNWIMALSSIPECSLTEHISPNFNRNFIMVHATRHSNIFNWNISTIAVLTLDSIPWNFDHKHSEREKKQGRLVDNQNGLQSLRQYEAMKVAGDSGCFTMGIHYSYRLVMKSGSIHMVFWSYWTNRKWFLTAELRLLFLSSLLLSLSILRTLSVVTEILNEKLHANVTRKFIGGSKGAPGMHDPSGALCLGNPGSATD